MRYVFPGPNWVLQWAISVLVQESHKVGAAWRCRLPARRDGANDELTYYSVSLGIRFSIS